MATTLSFAMDPSSSTQAIPFVSSCTRLLPGVALTITLAIIALALNALLLPALSPLMIAVVLGILLRNTCGIPISTNAGVKFSSRHLLRCGIVLLGLQISLTQIAAIGFRGFALLVFTLASTFVLTVMMGRILGVKQSLSELIAAGTSICGASAVIAANTVSKGSDEDVAYAVACVTLFGALSMTVFPPLSHLLALNAFQHGLWSGSAIHEIAQVAAAAFAFSDTAGEYGTIAKLTRVALLAPAILILGAAVGSARNGDGREDGRKRPVLPWFVIGFVALIFVNSIATVPAEFGTAAKYTAAFLLTLSLAGLGLSIDAKSFVVAGFRPLVLAAIAWIYISVASLVYIVAFI